MTKSKPRQGRFPYGKHIETDFKTLPVVNDIASVKNESGFHHGSVYFAIIQIPVQIPVRHNDECVAANGCKVGIFNVTDLPLCIFQIHGGVGQRLGIGDDH